MITIGIVRSTGSLQGDQVLRGVYGQYIPGDIDGGVGKFQIAPEFKRISHLFALLDNGQSPVQPRDMDTIVVEDNQEHLAKAQLMHAMATRWTKMYDAVKPSQVGMLGTMIAAESANVSTAAKNHLISMGMRAYLVPVTCEMVTSMSGSFLASERDLFAAARARNITIAEGGEAVDLGTDVLVSSLQQPARDMAAPAADSTAPTPQWANASYDNGVVAQVAGSIMVLAPSADQARAAAQIAIRLQTESEASGVVPEFMPEAITSVAPAPLTGMSDFEDSGYDADFDDNDGDRERGG